MGILINRTVNSGADVLADTPGNTVIDKPLFIQEDLTGEFFLNIC